MRRLLVASAVLIGVLAAVFAAVALVSVATPSVQAAGGCRCPLIYAPVICDNGKVYPNLCVAECHHAKNCVPYGQGP